jgi:toxin YoeB
MRILFSTQAWQDYSYWQETDKKTVKKINELIKDIARSPFQGLGKPEPLKHAFSGFWSRRISQEHRIIYRVEGDVIELAQLRYHY